MGAFLESVLGFSKFAQAPDVVQYTSGRMHRRNVHQNCFDDSLNVSFLLPRAPLSTAAEGRCSD